jgi:hypothetical protein
MLIAVFAALTLQQAAGTIAWETPSAAPEPEATEAATASLPALPDWAVADPYAWERSQCSPMIRKDSSMEACQVRVRTDLAAVLGDRLPAGLAPTGVEGCRQVSNGTGGYSLSCAPTQRTLTGQTRPPAAEVCEERPTRSANGVVSFGRECRPATGASDEDGLTLRLGDD